MKRSPPRPMVPARLDWPSTVGSFLLNFGTLEMLVFAALERHATPEVFARARRLHFKDRVSVLGECLWEAGLSAGQCEAFGRLVADLETVRALRNLVAHGTMLVSWEPGGEPPVSIVPSRDLDGNWEGQGSRRIEFDELFQAHAKLSELIEALKPLAGYGDTSSVSVGREQDREEA